MIFGYEADKIWTLEISIHFATHIKDQTLSMRPHTDRTPEPLLDQMCG